MNRRARDSRVTVVMLTHNRRVEILAALERIRALPEAPAVIVVDNASRDGTGEHLARRFLDVDVVRLRENRGAAGRNVGADHDGGNPYDALLFHFVHERFG